MINDTRHYHARREKQDIEAQLLSKKHGWKKAEIDKFEALLRKQPRRLYPGEESAQSVIDFLNDPNSPRQSKKRIELLLAEASRRQTASEPVTRQMTEKMLRVLHIEELAQIPDALGDAPFPDRPRAGQDGAFMRASWKIGSLLRAYKLTPVFMTTVNGRWIIDWHMPGRSKRMHAEAIAVLKVLDLAARGLLSRVKRCKDADCPRALHPDNRRSPVWFYQRFHHMQFHSAECQQHFFHSDPEQKKKHAAAVKESRRRKRLMEKRKDRVWLGNRSSAKRPRSLRG